MVKIVGVKFRGTGKVYSFDTAGFDLKIGDMVIVETVKCVEIGRVIIAPREINEENLEIPLKPVLRIATEADIKEDEKHKRLEKEARPIFYEKMRECGLDMKLVEVEYFFDNSKIMFYYTSDQRVDFRELVKELAGAFHARIELRQIGVRNETQYFGGIGVCGRELCCHAFLSDFGSATIKMAKDQELPLTSSKISGVCGRLICCLQNEHETYLYLNKNLPSQGDIVKNAEGLMGEVIEKSIIKQKLKVRFVNNRDEAEVKEYKADEVTRVYTRREYQRLLEAGEIKSVTYRKTVPDKNDAADDAAVPVKNSKTIDRDIDLNEKTTKYDKYDSKSNPLKAEKAERAEKTERSEKTDDAVREDKGKEERKINRGRREFRRGGYDNQGPGKRKN